MSKPVRFVITHSSDKPIDREAFIKASQAVSGYLRCVAFVSHGAIKPGWSANEDLIHFGGNPYDFDRQTSFNVARDPALYLKEGGEYPIEVRAMTQAYATVVRTVVALINYHTGNALVITEENCKRPTSRSSRTKRASVSAAAR